MKFLLDENFPRSSADFIESCGHEVIRFDEACDSGDDDEAVFSVAQRLGATILTSHRDFYHTICAATPGFARRRIHDLRLAYTLKYSGVTAFYTRNVKDFADVGFSLLENPLD